MPQAARRLRRRVRPVVQARAAVLSRRPERGDAGPGLVRLRRPARAGRGLPQAADGSPAREAWPGSVMPTRRARRGSSTCRSKGRRASRFTLPESDLTVKVEKVADFPTGEGGLFRVLGEAAIPVGMFQVKKGDGPEVEHFAMASLPMVPNVMPNPREPGGQAPAAAGLDPPDGPPRARPQDQRPVRPDRGPGRAGSLALLPRLRPGQGGQGRAPLGGAARQGEDDRRLRRRGGHAHDHQLPGRRLPSRGRREADLRAGRPAQGPDGRRPSPPACSR